MKLNQEFIQQLRNGEIAVENSGTLEQLREVIKAAFPKDETTVEGNHRFYFMKHVHTNEWLCFDEINLPIISVTDFYQPELFTGWAKGDMWPNWMTYFKEDIGQFGFNSFGEFEDDYDNLGRYSLDENTRPATHEEIETTLTQEAKRRGYKGGGTIKGIHGTTHWRPEIASFYYDAESDSLVTDMECVVYEKGQWAEIIEKPKPQPKKSNTIHYLIDGVEYSFNYQELKFRYEDICQYSDEQFMEELPEIAHLACIISYLKGLGNNATIGDKGIVHELIHLMTDPDEPTNDLQEIRKSFNDKIKLV